MAGKLSEVRRLLGGAGQLPKTLASMHLAGSKKTDRGQVLSMLQAVVTATWSQIHHRGHLTEGTMGAVGGGRVPPIMCKQAGLL